MNQMKSQQAQQLQHCCSESLWNCERLLEDVRSIAGRSIALGLRSFACAETRLPQTEKKKKKKTENKNKVNIYKFFFFSKILKTELKSNKTNLNKNRIKIDTN
jgi:hypothetical protein